MTVESGSKPTRGGTWRRRMAGLLLGIVVLAVLFVFAVSPFAIIGHLRQGHVAPYLLIGMLVCGFIGTWFGTTVGLKLRGPSIRKYFILVVVMAVVMVAIKLYLLLFGAMEL